MSTRNDIEIDYCPQCRGVWLDRGELDKIIARTASEEPPQMHQSHHDQHHTERGHIIDHDYDDRYKKHRKKNMLSEIFDF